MAELTNTEDINHNNALPTVQSNFIGRGRYQNRRFSSNRNYQNQGTRQQGSKGYYYSSSRDTSNIVCYNCHSYGHLAHSCKCSKSSGRGSAQQGNSFTRRPNQHNSNFRGSRGSRRGTGNRNFNSGNRGSFRGSTRTRPWQGRGRSQGRIHGVHADEYDPTNGDENSIGPDDSASVNQPAMQALSDLLPHLNL